MKTKLNSVFNWLRLLALASLLVSAGNAMAATPVVTWGTPAALTYPQPLGAAQLNATANVSGTFAYSPPVGTVLSTGTGILLRSVFLPDDPTYDTVVVNQHVDVVRGDFVVTPATVSRFYGEINPQLTGTVLLNGSPVAGVVQIGNTLTNLPDQLSLTFSTAAAQGSSVGTYSIVVTLNDPLFKSTNYFVTLNDGTLTVNRATLTVTPTPVSVVFGTTNDAIPENMPYTITSSTWPNELTNFTARVRVLKSSAAGDYLVNYTPHHFPFVGTYKVTNDLVSVISANPPLSNYNINYGTSTLTVTPAPLVFTGTNQTVAYGITPGLTGTITGRRVNTEFDDTLNISATYTTDGVNPGTYTLVPTPYENTPGRLLNYDITIFPGQLIITKRDPAIDWVIPTADRLITYGTALKTNQLSALIVNNPPAPYLPAPGLTFNPPLGTILNAGTPELTVTSSGDARYNAKKWTNTVNFAATATLVIQKASQSIVWTSPGALAYGQALSAVQLNATISVPGPSSPGLLAYDPSFGSYLNSGTNSLAALVAQTDNYYGAVTNISLVVAKGQVVFNGLVTDVLQGSSTVTLSGQVKVNDLNVNQGNIIIQLDETNNSPTITHGPYTIALDANGQFSQLVTFSDITHVTNTAHFPVRYAYASYDAGTAPAQNTNVFGLTNTVDIVVGVPTPVFTDLASPTYTYGVTSVVLGGKIKLPSGSALVGVNVDIKFDGVTHTVTSVADGVFTSTFTVAANHLTVVGSPYAIEYKFVDPHVPVQYNSRTDSSQSVKITRATLIVRPNSLSRKYGDANPSLWYDDVFGAVAGDTVNSPGSAITAVNSSTATATSPVGTYNMLPSVAFVPPILQNNYQISITNSANLTITNRLLIVVIEDKNRGTNMPNPTLTYHFAGDGFASGEGENLLSPAIQLQCAATLTSPLGDYDITAVTNAITAPNYTVVFDPAKGVLHVKLAFITWAPIADIFYGTALSTVQLNAQLFAFGTNATGNSALTVTYTPGVGTKPPKNSAYPLSVNFSGTIGGAPINETAANTVKVKGATMLIQAANATSAFGAPIATLAPAQNFYTVYGLVNNETATVGSALTAYGTVQGVQADGTTPLTPASPAGSYLVRAANVAAPNYDITYVDGIYTISQLTSSLTWAAIADQVYGPTSTAQDSVYVKTAVGSPGGGTYEYKIGSTVVTNGSILAAGSNSIVVSYTIDANYTVAKATNFAIVTKYPLAVTLYYTTNNACITNRVYGTANPAFPAVIDSFKANATADPAKLVTFTSPPFTQKANNGGILTAQTNTSGVVTNLTFATTNDNITTVGVALSTAATPNSSVGVYPVTVAANGPQGGNYNIIVTQAGDSLTIIPATLTVNTPPLDKPYGAAKPSFTSPSYAGSVSANIDTITGTWDAAVGTNSPLGQYLIVPTILDPSAKIGNYTIVYTPSQFGILSVVKAPLTVRADNKFRVINRPNPALTYSITGFVNNEDPGTNAPTGYVAPTATTTAVVASPEGTYPITLSGNDPLNYHFNFVNAILTIGPNHPPVANPDAVIRVPGDVLKIVKAKLTANDYDPDPGEVLSISSWSPHTVNGASIQTDATGLWLYYVPVSGSLSNSADSFTYTVADGNGGTASTTVYVLVTTSDANAIPKNIISASFNTDGSLNLRFIGIAGKSYYIQGSPTLITPAWLTLGTVTAQDSGFIDFVDTEAGTFPNRFYRAVIVP